MGGGDDCRALHNGGRLPAVSGDGIRDANGSFRNGHLDWLNDGPYRHNSVWHQLGFQMGAGDQRGRIRMDRLLDV